ncbi:hypothetical protein [Microbacterium sp. 22242]|uniref:hypothetical protein n=1 Tax=Microbacterium sp. 22242 TaxID=3453896 RepID=UPI003F861C21
MDLNYAMSYRITTLELEQAAIRAERARVVAEHADMIVPRDGILRRVLRRLRARRAGVPAPVAGPPATASVSAPPAPRRGDAAATPESVPAASAHTEEGDRRGELVGCAPHAA